MSHTSASAGPSVTCSDLTFRWSDGTPVVEGLSLTIGRGRTGLVGANGSGKSTLLRLFAGLLRPHGGSVGVVGRLAHLPQELVLDTDLRVEHVLGIAERRAALRAIEAGDPDERHFETIGDDWDVEERARATLDSLGLDHLDPDREVGRMSGGETVLLGLAARLLERPDVLLLDEPTNNLDLFARRRLHEAVAGYRSGVLIVVSHDADLLEGVDGIVELRPGGGTTRYGGGWTAMTEALETRREAADRALRSAESDVRRRRRDLEDTRLRIGSRTRHDRNPGVRGSVPRIVAGARKRAAQESAGKLRGVHEERLEEARERLDEAEEAARREEEIRVDLPHTAVPAGRTVLTLRGVRLPRGGAGRLDLEVRGPERVALIGRNGSGKSTLLHVLAGESEPAAGEARTLVPTRYLPQRQDVLDDALSIVGNIERVAPGAGANAVRARLARFLFRGARADRLVGTLSGGERFRACLAALMLAEPAPHLLMLDEPTNNLDPASVRQLTGALAAYRGALLVASHDRTFLEAIGVTRWVLLGEESGEIGRDEALALFRAPPAD
ncbi:ABC-F family ATP-binding cassette domain-containing protein [Streptomyces sp. ST2-7A]|uniref:ABC-F family ATP-binding cassette domain-containing protein n=1 Tax=Streptomyces sp. ST2-7A TaxID=2907214 RepID=UPI001F20F97E|nr:ABC-F family ATP-binding cassette domain-containing protein [Streptomyces sp. ST2-7A]MCE7081941.1 ATP-binding cassette domain-containing protein [Streptomyces sp. ST2-7A]